LAPWRWRSFGTGSSAGTESSIEVRQGLIQADHGWVELAHGHRQPVLREIVRRDAAGSGDQVDGPDRRLVVAVGQHVQMGMRHTAIIQPTNGIGQAAVAQSAGFHQHSQGLAERFSAVDHVFRITR
jgi:hypothetical protein